MEIACDESGSEGEKLVGGVTAVFAHASVRFSHEDASACVESLREMIKSPAREYKANHLLRRKNRWVLLWFLGPGGPLAGRARVQLVDKRRFLASRVRAEFGAVTGPLELYNDLLRAQGPRGALDPLFPAILRAVAQWGGPVSIVHDQQLSLTGGRIRQLEQAAPRLRSLTLADSRQDARVQVADFLAGIARRVAEEELHGRPDREVIELLRPFVVGPGMWHA
ncbi:NAD-dependent protein deacetylase of SIR2 family [Lentzea sp. DG1S-22]|uniref:NAD-dependent protein deacetylase of SIR2 family n=1 Tax=Lentzea sp. DG1S-22 TaxID=3108822 RepID=UPI002E76EC5A|nr:NAD-dependent protein deacetylase of SIR2 family [Lentzea sp. DG1S-22]WVH84023.1 NAD-dependent protein deacetylase of SIR2 family [Lentzea sp. DG1S-22]